MAAQTKTKGLRIATRCTSIDQFVTAFHRFCDAQTFFISTLSTRPIGLETAFSIELANNTPALRGIGVVQEAWATPKNPYGRPGLLLGIRRLTSDSEPVFDRLLQARAQTTQKTVMPAALSAVIVRVNTPRPKISLTEERAIVRAGNATVEPLFGGPATEPLSTEAPRTPGSELVLPANPLMGLDDNSLEGFVDCTLYEETANFAVTDPDARDDPADPTIDPPVQRASTISLADIASPLELDSPSSTRAATAAPAANPGSTSIASGIAAMAAGTTPPSAKPSLPMRVPSIAPTITPGSVIAASLANANAKMAPSPSTTLFADALPRSSATPPALPVVRADGTNARVMTEPVDAGELVEISEVRAAPEPDERPSLDSMLSGIAAPEVWPSAHRPAGPTADPAATIQRVGFAQPQPTTRWQTIRKATVELVTGPRRWWVAGGAAVGVLTIVIALVASSRSSTAADDSAAKQAAASIPPLPRDRARIAKPVADARTAKPEALDDTETPTGDTGAAPVFGSGPCKIAVSSTPAGSIISVDGEQAGPSPITIGGPCKPRKIDIAHPRYQTASRTVTGTPKTEPLEVTLARPTHDLYVESQPSGATVSIDGHRAGTTPTIVKIMGFTTLTMTIDKPGFKPQSKKFYSKSPHDRQSIKLVRNGGISDMVKTQL